MNGRKTAQDGRLLNDRQPTLYAAETSTDEPSVDSPAGGASDFGFGYEYVLVTVTGGPAALSDRLEHAQRQGWTVSSLGKSAGRRDPIFYAHLRRRRAA